MVETRSRRRREGTRWYGKIAEGAVGQAGRPTSATGGCVDAVTVNEDGVSPSG